MSSERNDLLRYEEAVARWLDRNRIGLRGKTVLAAFSGGADSAALLLLLNAMRARGGFSLCAAHVNHKIRGAEAERDARFCETFCAQRGIPFRLLTGDAPRLAAERGTGMEDAARVLRYRLLDKAAGEMNAAWIATAHTADDHLETVLLNLARGGAARGLSGIRPVNGRIIRPFLPLERADTERIVSLFGASYVTDSSNASDCYARNRLRRSVVPVLRDLNADVCRGALENSRILREEDEFLDSLAAAALTEVGAAGALSARGLTELPAPLRARAARLWAEQAGIALDRRKTEAVLALAGAQCPSAVCDLGGGRVCRRNYDRLLLENARREPAEDFCVPLRLGESLAVGSHFTAAVSFLPANQQENRSVYKLFNHCFVNCDTIKGEITIRNRRAGDRFARNGGSGAKPLKQVFTDLKIPRHARPLIPVVADEAGVIWVYGIGYHFARAPYQPEKDGYRILFQDNNKTDGALLSGGPFGA